MNKKNTILIIIVAVTLITVIGIATYAYFATGLMNIINVANLNVVTERNNMVFDTIGGEMSLNVTAANMVESLSGNIAIENDTTLIVNFTPNTDYRMVCTYDIVYEWTSSDRYTIHSPGEDGIEFGIVIELEPSAGVSSGTNYAEDGVDLSDLVGNQNSATVVSGASIAGTGANTTTAVWYIGSWFYNSYSDQSSLSGKTYAGRFKVANVSCVAPPRPTSYWFDEFHILHTHPNYSGTVQSTGTATGHNVYIGQDSSKYYACATIQGHEICLSQPYTQYGLSGHTLNSNLTSEQKASVKQAIYQAFNNAGIELDISNCGANGSFAFCDVDTLSCEVSIEGYVYCNDGSATASECCEVDASGRARCSS